MSAQSQSAARLQPQLGGTAIIIIRTTIITTAIIPTTGISTRITLTTTIIGTAGISAGGRSNSKAASAPTPDGFAFVPLRAVFSDGIRSVVGPARERVRLAFTSASSPFRSKKGRAKSDHSTIATRRKAIYD